MKKTLVLGASDNPARYSFLAINRLLLYGHEVAPVGTKTGTVGGLEILHGQPQMEGVDTVTLYLRPERQREYYDYILSLKPQRIIFNPGTENPELVELAENHGIECVEGCTLVMLSTGSF